MVSPLSLCVCACVCLSIHNVCERAKTKKKSNLNKFLRNPSGGGASGESLVFMVFMVRSLSLSLSVYTQCAREPPPKKIKFKFLRSIRRQGDS
jgi:hypothetical protein